MATIVDVARRAGVSPSTVSHVINGTRTVRVETAGLVTSAIAATGYRPNTIARSLARSSTSSVGIALSTRANPYFNDILRAAERECARLGMMVFLADTDDDPERELSVLQALQARRVDGVILAPSARPDAALASIRETSTPCVLIDRLTSDRFDQVGVDNAAAMRLLVEHLLGHGHRRIALVTGQPGFATTNERRDAFRETLAAHGIVADPALITEGSRNVEEAADAAFAILSRQPRPTAIATGNNLATIGTMRALRRAGLHAPTDLALACFDDFEWADCFEPQLTAIAQPCDAIGEGAASLLVSRIRDGHASPRTLRLAPRLIVRNSCGCNLDV